MPRRKKSTAKPKGDKSGISINIKNILKQVQNEKPTKQDFINLSGKRPMDNLDFGNMTRLQTPAMTYASRPLSQFPSLASLSNVTREFAPPLSQLTSKSTQPLGSSPSVAPEQDRQNDALEGFRPSTKIIKSNPVPSATSSPFQAEYGTRVYDRPAPVERYLVPAGLPSNLLSAYDGKEDPSQDQAERLVAQQMDQDARRQEYERNMREAEAFRAEQGLRPFQPPATGKKGRKPRAPEPAPVAAASAESPPRSETVRRVRD